MGIYTQCIYDYESESGKLGIAVPLQLTDFVGNDLDVQQFVNYDIHLSVLAPNRELILDYGVRNVIDWKEYEVRFLDMMEKNDYILKLLKNISNIARDKDVFFLCLEEKFERCHRRLLLEKVLGFNSNLKAGHYLNNGIIYVN